MRFSLSPREYVFLVLLVATPVAMWYLVFKPQNDLTEVMMSQMQHMTEKLGQYEQVREMAVENVEGDIDQLEAAMAIINSRLPDSDELGQVVQEINELAANNNLAVIRMNPNKGENELTRALSSKFGSLWLRIELQGDFMNLYRFLQQMEVQPKRILRINYMKINTTRGAQVEPGTVNVDLQILTFYRLPQEDEEPKNQPATTDQNRSA